MYFGRLLGWFGEAKMKDFLIFSNVFGRQILNAFWNGQKNEKHYFLSGFGTQMGSQNGSLQKEFGFFFNKKLLSPAGGALFGKNVRKCTDLELKLALCL